jgi:hypothetical protein
MTLDEYYNSYTNTHRHTGWLTSDNAEDAYDRAIDDGFLLFQVHVQDYWNGNDDHLVAFKTEEELIEAIERYNECDGAIEGMWFIEDGDYELVDPKQIQ